MRRRAFLALLGNTLITSRISAHAEQATRRHIGYLSGSSERATALNLGAFLDGLRALGYREDEIKIEARYANGDYERLPDLAIELVRLSPEVILATSPPAVVAAEKATSTIPIVFPSAGDPVGLGLVASLAHPGGNATGLSTLSEGIVAKWVQFLKTAAPAAERVAFLMNPANPAYEDVLAAGQRAARNLGTELFAIDVRSPDDLDAGLTAVESQRADALICWGDPVLLREKRRIVEFATRHKLPAIYQFSDFVAIGGLMSYGPSLKDLYRRAATYVDKILNGAKPADLPVEQPTKFDLVLNLKAAESIGITLPPLLIARADEVIE